MSILDDAIRQHLELKRANGADEGELKRLEDEAFGPTQRPDEADPFAEAPTEFLVSPTDTPAAGADVAPGSRRPDIADLQEAPPAEAPVPVDAAPPTPAAPPAPVDAAPPAAAPSTLPDELSPAPDAPPPSPADAADVPLPPPPAEEITPGPTTEERHAIADQPTQMFDVQAHLTGTEPAAPPTEQPSPTDEQLVDAAQNEPQAAPPVPEEPVAPAAEAAPVDVAPPTEPAPPVDATPSPDVPEQAPLASRGPDAEVAGHPPTEEESAEYDFMNEQRLADELDQALEAPITAETALPTYDDAAAPAGGGVFDFEQQGQTYEEDPSEEVLRRIDEPPSEETAREHEAPSRAAEPPSEEIEPTSDEFEPVSDEYEPPSEETPRAAAEPPSEESDIDYDPDTGHEDVLEDTPRFLENAPEDDDLWFEQKPPKDFDLD